MLTRRQFIRLVMATTAAFELSDYLIPHLAEAFVGKKKPPVIWLEMMTCTGDYLSLANTLHPNMRELLFDTIDLYYSNTTMAAEGDKAIDALINTVEREKGEFILIAEGTVPLKAGGRYGAIGHHKDGRLFTDEEALKYVAPKAKYIMAVGTCASFGGPYAAHPNPSGSVPVHKVVDQQVINVPGCPVHPDWAVGTLTHLLLYGVPNLDAFNRPTVFFGRRIHDWCPRRQHFDNGVFAEHPGEEKCTYKIGCKGPVTFSDCPTRQWIGEHNSWPVGANSPCIGCVSPDFPDGMSPFYAHLSNISIPGIRTTADKLGLGVAAVTAGGIGTHLLANVVTGRLGRHLVNGTKPSPEGVIRDTRKHAGDDLKEVVFLPREAVGKAAFKRYRVKKSVKGNVTVGRRGVNNLTGSIAKKSRHDERR
ncbi:MAG: hydrogenase small subunit [Eubacteriales bacterium]